MRPAVVIQLLRARADPNIRNSFGSTPLHYACYGGHRECVRVLLDNGADASIRDELGRTPRDDAQLRAHAQVLELLATATATAAGAVPTPTPTPTSAAPVIDDDTAATATAEEGGCALHCAQIYLPEACLCSALCGRVLRGRASMRDRGQGHDDPCG